MKNFHLDYEVYSEADLPVVGTYRYAADPSTEVLMFAIATDDEGPYLWVHPRWRSVLSSNPRADLLVASIGPDDLVWAHYATFEVAVTKYRRSHEVPFLAKIQLHQWRCTSLLGRCAAMPSKLEKLAETLQLTQRKDPKGAALIRMFCIPQDDGGCRILPSLQPEKFAQLGSYCLQDVRAERSIHTKLKPFELRGALLDAWLFDLRMNDRGFPVNCDALRRAQEIIEEASGEVADKFCKLTGLQPTQNKKMREFLAAKGLEMENLQADTVEETLEGLDPTHPAYTALQLYSQVQFAAVKKVKAMLDSVCPDGWIRGMLLFHGAGTGRWAGRGVQPQNFKRPTIKGAEGVYAMICKGRTREHIELIYGNVLDAISSCIRNFIQPAQGDLLDADYNAIEARIICWLAGQFDRLSEWERGIDQYKIMAGKIYNRPAESIINPSDEREVGKRTILGCGFGMGSKKFQKTCKDQYGLDVPKSVCDKAVMVYRETHDNVQRFWWSCQRAAIKAIQHPGEIYKAGAHISFWTATVNGIKFLFMRLPSGRKIVYPWPELQIDPDRDGSYRITFMAEVKGKWMRTDTYGGKLAENATQGVAADIMMNGAVKAEKIGAEIIMLVHDQAPALHRKVSLKDYVAALTDLPSWAAGLPIKAEGRIVPYYKK